jgi:hypothetical protein
MGYEGTVDALQDVVDRCARANSEFSQRISAV